MRKALNTDRFVISRLIEVVDGRDRVIGAMPLVEVRKQSALHRAVAVLAFFPDNRLYLRKRPEQAPRYPGRFDVSGYGRVNLAEAREETAWRVAHEILPFRVEAMVERGFVSANHHTGHAFVSVYSARAKAEALDRVTDSQGALASEEEFNLLLEQFRDLLAPGLVHLHENRCLFPPWRGAADALD